MQIAEQISTVRAIRWQDSSSTWGFVPTMGYLHEGHLSLVRQARRENDRVAVSIYVNPTQFSPGEDFAAYPRDIPRDLRFLQESQVDLVWTPAPSSIYPGGFQTYVSVEEVTKTLEGASRPTHFRGVATIVAKLFNVVQPHRAYFGQKDAQQVAVIQRMVQDLNFPIDIVVCPISRENDGLARSSRNVYLSPSQRQAAPILYRSLCAAQKKFAEGERNGDCLRQLVRQLITSEPLARLDYVSLAHRRTLVELDTITDEALLSLAVFFDNTRLIDNIILEER